MSKLWTPAAPAIIRTTEELLARLRDDVARELAILPGLVVIPSRFIAPGTQDLTSGTTFVIPEHNTITVELVGASSGGAAANGAGGNDNSGRTAGGATTISSLSLTANGGGLAAGGTATGGDINETGRVGGAAGGANGGNGGGAGASTSGPKGGGGAGATASPDGNGFGGAGLGGGGGGGKGTNLGAAGGCGGGYCLKTYSAGTLVVGSSLTYAIGAAGSPALRASAPVNNGGAGRTGVIRVTWN